MADEMDNLVHSTASTFAVLKNIPKKGGSSMKKDERNNSREFSCVRNRRTVNELLEQYDALAERARAFSYQPQYRRYGAAYRIWAFVGIPLIMAAVWMLSWRWLSGYRFTDPSLEGSLLRPIMVTIAAVGIGMFADRFPKALFFEKYTFLPLSDYRAIGMLERQIKFLTPLCGQADAKKAELQPLIAEFAKLGSLIVNDSLGRYYDLKEELIGDEVRFFVKVKFFGQLFSRKYYINTVQLERLERETAHRWIYRHCNDNEEEVLSRFKAELQEM